MPNDLDTMGSRLINDYPISGGIVSDINVIGGAQIPANPDIDGVICDVDVVKSALVNNINLAGSRSGFRYTLSDTPPVNPSRGDKWFKTDSGAEYIFYDNFWVSTGDMGVADHADDWFYLVSTWTVEPTFLEAISGGEVYSYTLGATTRFRFVPEPYDPTLDSFYASFSSPTLSTFLCSRG